MERASDAELLAALRADFARDGVARYAVAYAASDPVTTVPIPPITFEPFDWPRRQIVGEPSPRRLSRKVGWQKQASCTDIAE